MKPYETIDIRNVALAGHGHSGKTSLAAAMLFASGATNKLMRVDDGNTITDFDDEEIQRKITISTGVAAAEWSRKKINILDTPGFNIFINDTKGSMIAADAAVIVVDGAGWHSARELVTPDNITLITLPPYSPELNPVENLWHYLRSHWLSSQVFADIDAITDACVGAWNRFVAEPALIASVCRVDWAMPPPVVPT